MFTSNWISRPLLPPKAELKKCEAYFFKGQKAAAFQLCSPPAGEAKATN